MESIIVHVNLELFVHKILNKSIIWSFLELRSITALIMFNCIAGKMFTCVYLMLINKLSREY